ncbi:MULTISPECIES: HAD-IIB family hydrolase [unclassified Guyparkeria]|uniref:HAD-IIB family hydrolase n=1 Tax=unclassified Guyparkeria TaxID=2626246 RepID=UPI0007339182|nr:MULTISPECIES: HAD-IIB family hydrolase [unclassified Guyparkeria]KTG17773.1 haloacid dehalogenase [Guyparkeria sp. XI15]OAE89484.1 haloacid dehalogenase [Guyparkeria sp. WRN-7]
MTDPLLICTDLDRTLIPNGHQPESPGARDRLARLVEDPGVVLAYVSGRDERLLHEAIARYDLPRPDFAIGDVGTTIYRIEGADWQPWADWYREIAPDWSGHDHADLARRLEGIDGLERQEPAKQNTYKLSYYSPADIDAEAVITAIQGRLEPAGIRASVIWSVDEMNDVGLIDVLPLGATKLHAIRFIQSHLGIPAERTVFAGDSGNDLPALTSELPAVLVANARPEVRETARRLAHENGTETHLYLARGGFLGMNGNYAAGILEGIAHYHPATVALMT